MTALRIDVADLLAHRVSHDEPVALDLVLERISDGIVVRGSLTTHWRAECSNCLTGLENPLSLDVNELFEEDPLEGDTYPIEGHEIDLEQLVRDTVILELPLAPICADTGAPACVDEAAPRAESPPPEDLADPRWAPLSQLDLSEPNQGEA